MNNSISHFTLIKILKKFSRSEINEFEKFLNSPFYNNHSTIVKLYSELKKYYPDFDDIRLSKKQLFSIASQKKKYDDRLFRKYLSRINKLAEEYLNVLQMRSEPYRTEINILIQLYKRELDEVFNKKLNAVENIINKNGRLDSNYYQNLHHISRLKYNVKINDNYFKSFNEELFNSSNYLLNYFLSEASFLLNQIEINNYSFSITNKVNPLSTILNVSGINEYINILNKNKSIGFKDTILFLEIIINDINLNSPSKGAAAFNNLNKLFQQNSGKFSDEMLSYILQRMNVFCIIENIKGVRNWDKELFKNYKLLIENNLLNSDGKKKITILDFRSILSVALKNKEYNWAENFITDNFKNIKDERMTDIRNYGTAILLFHKKMYSDSLDYITKIKSKSLPVVIDIYVLKMKIFYIQGYFDTAAAVADSFRHFINGNKLIGELLKITLNNFLKYYRKILIFRIKKDQKRLLRLKSELKKSNNTRDKKWILEIIDDHIGNL